MSGGINRAFEFSSSERRITSNTSLTQVQLFEKIKGSVDYWFLFFKCFASFWLY